MGLDCKWLLRIPSLCTAVHEKEQQGEGKEAIRRSLYSARGTAERMRQVGDGELEDKKDES